jgi:hypothetical protein
VSQLGLVSSAESAYTHELTISSAAVPIPELDLP